VWACRAMQGPVNVTPGVATIREDSFAIEAFLVLLSRAKGQQRSFFGRLEACRSLLLERTPKGSARGGLMRSCANRFTVKSVI